MSCWGIGLNGKLGYGNTDSIGDDETPGSAGAVNLGAGRTATSITAGSQHTCAILDNGEVSCWGLGSSGRLGYGNTDSIGDDETPASAGAVNLGAGRTATSITAGSTHTCAVLDNGEVICWGIRLLSADSATAITTTSAITKPPTAPERSTWEPAAPPPRSPPATITPARSSTTAR